MSYKIFIRRCNYKFIEVSPILFILFTNLFFCFITRNRRTILWISTTVISKFKWSIPVIIKIVVCCITSFPFIFRNRIFHWTIWICYTGLEYRVWKCIIANFNTAFVHIIWIISSCYISFFWITHIGKRVEVPFCIIKLSMSRNIRITLFYKNNTVYKLHWVFNLFIPTRCRSRIWQIIIISFLKKCVICHFRRSHIYFKIQPVIRNGVSSKRYLTITLCIFGSIAKNKFCFIIWIKINFTIYLMNSIKTANNINVSCCKTIFIRGSALSSVTGVSKFPVIKFWIAIYINTFHGSI